MTLLYLFIQICVAAAAFGQSVSQNKSDTTEAIVNKTLKYGCVLPPKPLHGRYEFVDPTNVDSGVVYDTMRLNVVCDTGYGIVKGSKSAYCISGYWGPEVFAVGECEQYCATPKNETIEYRCPVDPVPPKCFEYLPEEKLAGVPCPIPEGADKGFRICKEYEKNGTVVKPVMKSSSEELPKMTCSSGSWEVKPSNMTEINHRP